MTDELETSGLELLGLIAADPDTIHESLRVQAIRELQRELAVLMKNGAYDGTAIAAREAAAIDHELGVAETERLRLFSEELEYRRAWLEAQKTDEESRVAEMGARMAHMRRYAEAEEAVRAYRLLSEANADRRRAEFDAASDRRHAEMLAVQERIATALERILDVVVTP